MQNSTGLYRHTRVGKLPSRTVPGYTGIPGVGQLPGITVQGCAGIPGTGQVRQVPSRIVQGCTVAALPLV